MNNLNELLESAKAVLLGEAKEMSQKMAIEILKIIKDKKSYDDFLSLSIMDRNKLKAATGEKLTRDVPNADGRKTLFGTVVTIASGKKDSFYFDNGNFVKGDKTIVANAVGKKTFGELAKVAKIKL